MTPARADVVLLSCALLLAACVGVSAASPCDCEEVASGLRAGLAVPAAETRSTASGGLALVTSLDARDELLEASAETGSDPGVSPGVATLASLAVPGTGQLLKGEKRGYAYLVAEIAFWVAYAALNQEGLDIRDDYEAYARAEWNYDDYVAFYEEYCTDCGNDCPDGCRPLAEYGTQEYYEDIGKYSVYWPWWEIDGDEGVPGAEPSDEDLAVRGEYWTMRKDSNRNLRNARYFMTAAFLNHIVSAVDAYLTSGDRERGLDGEPTTGLIFDVADTGAGLRCGYFRTF